jgi:hypothetical protein
MKFLSNTFLMAALAVLVLGCTSVVPSSVVWLQQTSPLEADPSQIAARLTLPEGLGVLPGSASLTLSAMRKDTGETLSEVYPFDVQQSETALFRFSPKVAARLAQQQATLRAWDAEPDVEGNASLTVDIEPCRIGGGPTPEARVSVHVQLDEDTGFLPLIRNGPISAVAQASDIADMEPCN